MRTGIVASCVALALFLGGCDTLDWRYTNEGVGTELYAPETVNQARLQEIYVGYICQQAGLSYEERGEILFCREPPVSRNWQIFVQAGMNDIDRRCDAYLTWLDNKRRWVGPIHQQILDTEAATLLILGATAADPTKAIAVVGAAFGLASHAFTNFNSRFIFEVEKSTVQSVVLTRQQKYRETLPVVIDNRPAAIYALRQYLRLCMPMTIETQINTTVKLFERGGTVALEQAAAHPMVDARTVSTAATVRITKPASDASYIDLRSLLFPNGAKTIDPELKAYIGRLLGSDKIAIGVIVTRPEFSGLRRRISACIVSRSSGSPCADGSLAKFIQ
ncbi:MULTISPECIES: hypothetical protein [Bradyrhizobium]|uniref:Lipoprotein n=1 Tax=Bradyrhizobium vignae TaxID=1549949 RepID=A0A2U3PSH8_9BRAD|nr:hypothetical protein [Bradyrhizobium vignae]MBP0111105.1 hypothetical protein [Bradyrhizobium vignae]RXG88764.1 hypothetical protein EAV90_30500 [Bradyrhizobium vignae]SPP92074.1 conserved protein of unknown function [Bradyrhizobium vignae]